MHVYAQNWRARDDLLQRHTSFLQLLIDEHAVKKGAWIIRGRYCGTITLTGDIIDHLPFMYDIAKAAWHGMGL